MACGIGRCFIFWNCIFAKQGNEMSEMLWADLEVGDTVRVSDEIIEVIKSGLIVSDIDSWIENWAYRDLVIKIIQDEKDYIWFEFQYVENLGFSVNKTTGKFIGCGNYPVVLKIVKLKDD